MNYSELVTAIQEYLQSTETTFVSQIPTFVRQAEERINRAVLIPDLRKVDTTAMTSGTALVAKPSDFLAPFAFSLVSGTTQYTMLLKDESFIREAYPDSTVTNIPVYYAHYDDDNWIVGPTPDDNYATSLRYYYDPESIVTAGTSWLGDNAETVLLYGALVEGYTFQKGDPDLLALYDKRYMEALDALLQLGMVLSKRDDYRENEIRRIA